MTPEQISHHTALHDSPDVQRYGYKRTASLRKKKYSRFDPGERTSIARPTYTNYVFTKHAGSTIARIPYWELWKLPSKFSGKFGKEALRPKELLLSLSVKFSLRPH